MSGEELRTGTRLAICSSGQEFGVDAVEPVGADPAGEIAHLLLGVAQVQDAALAEHDVVVEFAAEVFPELERELVNVRASIPEVVGAHDGGVAPHAAAAQPASLEHGDVGDAVDLGEVVGRG